MLLKILRLGSNVQQIESVQLQFEAVHHFCNGLLQNAKFIVL